MSEPSQHLGVEGAGAVGVQVIGANAYVSVVVGGATLLVQRIHALKTQPKTLLELLRVDIRATRLVGRGDELQSLAQWRDTPDAVAVRCIIGQAGAGKTRLAVEACEAAEAAGWMAGFVSGEELTRFHATQSLANWRPDKDCLLVLDYAASSLTVLRKWLDLLAHHRRGEAGPRLRILLLERHADLAGGWWAELGRRESRDRPDASDLLGEQTPMILLPPNVLEDRRALLAEAMALAAPLHDPPVSPAPQPPAVGVDSGFDERLATPRIENGPLYLLMAGGHAVHHGAPAALSLGASDLAADMARFEMARLRKFARARGLEDDGALLRHLAACVTLQNGCSRQAVAELVAREMREMHFAFPGGPSAASKALFDCLTETGGKLDAIRPDLVGEAFAILTVEDAPHRQAEISLAVVLRAYERDPSGVSDTLIRAACDHALGSGQHVTIGWLKAVVEASTDLDTLVEIASRIPENTLALREFAVDVTTKVIAMLDVEDGDIMNRGQVASWLNNLANRLSDLGRREGARVAAEQAVELWELLAEANPEVFTGHLATSLSNLCNFLNDLALREEAVAVAERAVGLRRKHLAANPNSLSDELATSLINLSVAQSEIGHREKALATAEEAVSLLRVLVGARPGAFEPELATALGNLANRLRGFGQPAAALKAAQESVQIRRRLAAEQPDAFTPVLATSIHNIAGFLSDQGLIQAALDHAQEAVSLRRGLAAERPDAFAPTFATSLGNLGIFLATAGRIEEAMVATEEASTLLRGLVAESPDIFVPSLATALINQSSLLAAAGHLEPALAAAQEGVELQRGLVAKSAEAFAPNLAAALGMMAVILNGSDRSLDAIESTREGIAVLAPHFLAYPPAHGVLMTSLTRDYIDRSRKAGVEPDFELLEPIFQPLSAFVAEFMTDDPENPATE